MSIDIGFEKVSRAECKGTLKEIPENIRFVRESLAEDWEKGIGAPCKYEYETVDVFDVGEKLYGKRPESVTYGINYRTFNFEDGTKEAINEEVLKPFYYNKVDDGYVYKFDTIGYLDHPYFFDEITKEGFVSDSDMDKMIDAVLDGEGNYYAEDLLIILRAKRALDHGETIVCRKE